MMTDLDARVAALMRKVAYYRYAPIEVADKKIMDLEQAIRAELQKPALHEPCTWDEINEALTLAYGKQDHYHQSTRDRMESALNHVLQGRAQPAQEEITGMPDTPTFVAYLIDHHEGEEVFEESLQKWLAECVAQQRVGGCGDIS